MALQIYYIGNFEPPHSTENDLHRTMVDMGVHVLRRQEQNVDGWEGLLAQIRSSDAPDAVMWTRTASLSDQVPADLRRLVQIEARRRDIPTIGVHLDRWWGLQRESSLYNDPFFRCEYLFTADGHDPDRWEALGANHTWMPPAIAPHNVKIGTPRGEYECDIAFVGSWSAYGHLEWEHRVDLVSFLRRTYGKRVRFWPEANHPAVRGDDLADLYASCKIVVGDSCLVPDGGLPWTNYCSDRVFETIGRGGFLLHPYVRGVMDGTGDSLLTPGVHCQGWFLGDWIGLQAKIDQYLDLPGERAHLALQGFEHVKAHHTYANRLSEIFLISLGEEVPHGQAESTHPTEDPEAKVRSPWGAQVPHPRSCPCRQREGASDPAVQAGPDLEVHQEPDPLPSEQGPEAQPQEVVPYTRMPEGDLYDRPFLTNQYGMELFEDIVDWGKAARDIVNFKPEAQ